MGHLCLLALDAATGRRVWHFQFVHHDLWDRDLPAPACGGGKMGTRSGDAYVAFALPERGSEAK